LQGPCTIAIATAFAIGASATGRAQDASRLQWKAPHLCFQHRHGRICLCRSFGATANQAKKVVGCCHLVFAGNDRDTSNSIETSDAAAKKLGDQFFEKLAAVFGPTPKLAVLPRPPTNQRGVVRAAFVVAVLLYVSRYSFGN
jgi:hypothetical protein